MTRPPRPLDPTPRFRAEQPIPDELSAVFAASGWLRDDASDDALYLRWCASDWESGLAGLTRITTERERSRTVLCGVDAPADIGERLRTLGALAWLAPPYPAWMMPMLARTLWRSLRERPLHRIRGIQPLERLSSALPEDVVVALAERAAALLECEAEAWWADPGATFRHLGERPPRSPDGLYEAAARFAEPVVVPWVAAARVCTPTDPAVVSAVAIPVLRATALDEPTAVVVLTWDEPFLPTVGEVRLLELLGLFGRLVLRAHQDRDRLARAHALHTRALDSLIPSPPAWPGPVQAPGADELVARVLAARPTEPELLELHARLSASSRGTPPWHRWCRHDAPMDEEALQHLLEWVTPGTPVAWAPDRWSVVEPIGPEGGLGTLIAVFSTREAAQSGMTSLHDMAASLVLGAHVLRWSADATALTELSSRQTDASHPEAALDDMIGRIGERMSADGVRLHLVRRGLTGPMLRVERTWTRAGVSLSGPIPAVEAATDVVRTGAWSRTPSKDGTTWHLTAALHAAGHPCGALDVWRATPEPFDDHLDPDALLRFAPHVSAAARRVLHLELVRARLAAMAELLGELDPGRSVGEAARKAVDRVRRLGGASVAVLFRRAPSGGPVYAECASLDDDDLGPALNLALAELQVDRGALPWTDGVEPALTACLSTWGLPLAHRLTLPSPHPDGTQPTSAIALLDRVPPGEALPPFAPEVQDESATELFHYTAALLENATRIIARHAADRLTDAADDPAGLLRLAARAIRESTDVDAVVLALGDRHDMLIRHVDPERQSLHGEALTVAGDDLSEPERARFLRTFGWSRLRCVEVVPIEDRGRRLGVLLALTSDEGAWIGWHRRHVLRQVGSRLALELDKAVRRARLEAIHALAARLTGLTGVELARRLVEDLTVWARTYVRHDVDVAVVARTHDQQTLLATGPSSWGDDPLRALTLASRRWGRRQRTVGPTELAEILGPTSLHALAAPLMVHDKDRLTGHLVVLSRHRVDETHLPGLIEAARETAVLLDAERVRHSMMAETGLFRHALLSPVQGLTDAALFLAELTELKDPDPDLIIDQRVRIIQEAEKIRQWRQIQRLYGGGLLGGEIRLRPRRQPLRPIIDLCMKRFVVTMQHRGIELLLDWELRGPGLFTFDADALDIVLSNLLDNAAKYSFHNRHVSVFVRLERHVIKLGVADFGHPLPEEIDIYASGERMPWEDPFRKIQGEGLGLFIVRSLVVAMGGTVTHECRPEKAEVQQAREETRPYVVRFTVTLPRDEG